MRHKISKEYIEIVNRYKLTCTEGCKITKWQEGDDIRNYAAFDYMYCNADEDISLYRCVTLKQDKELQEKQIKAFGAGIVIEAE